MIRNSYLIPSRKRFDKLIRSIKSVQETSSDPELNEFLIKFDKDDVDSINRIEELNQLNSKYKIIISSKQKGYPDLHKFVNALCEISEGKFLTLWNDDAIIEEESKYWDMQLDEIDHTKPVVLTAYEGLNLFPICSRKVFEIIGHFSMNPHNDSYMQDIGYYSGITQKIHLNIKHAFEESDETHKVSQGWYLTTSPTFFAPECRDHINKAIEKIKNYGTY
jgi:hypothetical protein